MSGLEVAGLVVGIVPIVVEILKSYSVARDRLRTFAHYTQVVYDVQLRYRVAATNFGNDCQLLLKTVVDDARELSQMIDDPKHGGWQDSLLEERLHKFLGRDYQLFEQVVVRIRDVLRETRARLSEFDQGLLPAAGALKRLYAAFDITCKENSYRKWLDDLDQWNKKLSRLRSQRCKLQKQPSHPLGCMIRKSIPKRYTDIHTASQRLHDSLRDSWSCTNISHVGHQAKLSLDAQADYGAAQLDIVIACRRKPSIDTPTEPQQPIPETPMWLHVRSITNNEPGQTSVSMSPAILGKLLMSTHPPPAPLVSSATVSATQSVVERAKKTLKRVRFEKSSDPMPPPSSPPHTSKSRKAFKDATVDSFTMLNLKATTSICCHLNKACQSETGKDVSLGYLESLEAAQSFRFMFYDAGRNTETSIAQNKPTRNSFPIVKELANLQVLHQLVLAHKLAKSVLQFHSTPWLSSDWNLQDVSCFTSTSSNMDSSQSSEDDITKKLQTLHLSTQFPSESPVVRSVPKGDLKQLKSFHGIRNLTLAELGVALLEIGTKKNINDQCLDLSTPDQHRIVSARKIMMEEPASLSALGKRYTKMAQKCIYCDFSCGDDLSDEALQSAVYTEVVCELESQIADWKKFIGLE